MNKLLHTTLITAIMATSAFSTQFEIQSDTVFESGTTVELENGTSYVFFDGTTLHNYTTIQGPTAEGEIANFKMSTDTGTANVINYKDALMKNTGFTKYSEENLKGNYYTPEALGKITGNIAIAEGVKVTGATIDLIEGGVLQTLGSTDVAVLIGEDADSMSMTNSSDSSLAISQNIANEKTAENGKLSKGLVINGKFEFTGDQSHFTEENVSFTDAEVTFSGEKSLFQTDMEFNKSNVILNQNVPIYFGKSITVYGGTFSIRSGTNFTLTSGGSLFLEALNYGWNYPTVTTWTIGQSSVVDGNTISHDSVIKGIKKYSSENNITGTEMEFYVRENGGIVGYQGINYSDGVFTYLGTNDDVSSDPMPEYNKGTTDPFKVTKYIRKYPDLVYFGKKAEARTIGYDGGDNPYTTTIDNQEYKLLSVTHNSGTSYNFRYEPVGYSITHSSFNLSDFEGNDSVGYYYNTANRIGGQGRADKLIYWYFNEWDGVEGAVTE